VPLLRDGFDDLKIRCNIKGRLGRDIDVANSFRSARSTRVAARREDPQGTDAKVVGSRSTANASAEIKEAGRVFGAGKFPKGVWASTSLSFLK